MKKILSGIQASGNPHLGNYLGAMKHHIKMQETHECFIFIADLHALTTVKDPEKMKKMTQELAIDYISLGLDPDKTVFFRQSDIHQHTELAWILSTVTPMGLLERAHAYKDAVAKKTKEPTVGLFTYPVLMAADILLYKPDIIPVGKDQKQHIEITRDVAEKFNNTYGETFPLPNPYIQKENSYIIGTDGKHKMSKSYGNVIEFFADEKTLKKQVMGIKTDSTPLEKPKDPSSCAVFQLYSHFSTKSEQEDLAKKYQKGGFGYGDAKKILLERLMEYFKPFREKRIELQNDLGYIERELEKGAQKARKTAQKTMAEVKKKIGISF